MNFKIDSNIKDYPNGLYIIKGQEAKIDEDHIKLQTNGVGCNSHYMKGDFYKIADSDTASKYMIFNPDFWYNSIAYWDNDAILPIPNHLLERYKNDTEGSMNFYKLMDNWCEEKYGMKTQPDFNWTKYVDGIEKICQFREALYEACKEDCLHTPDLISMIQTALKEIADLNVKIIDSEIEEAFVRIEVLDGSLQGPAYLTWDNCD